MAVLFDDDVLAYQLIAIPLSSSRPAGYAIYASCPEVQLTNIRLWGILRLYRLRNTPLGNKATVLQSLNLRAPDERFFNLESPQVGVQDGVQLIPTYDLQRVVIFDNQP